MTYRKLYQHLFTRFKPYDVTPEQWSLLNHLCEQEGINQKELAARLGKDPPTTTRILDGLDRKQLIRRQPNPDDRRSFLIFLTEEGRSIAKQLLPIEQETIKAAVAGLNKEQIEVFLQVLNHINDNIDQSSV